MFLTDLFGYIFYEKPWIGKVLVGLIIALQITFITIVACGVVSWNWLTAFLPAILVLGCVSATFGTALLATLFGCDADGPGEITLSILHVITYIIFPIIMIIVIEIKDIPLV